jgi:hypothetical protein
MEMSEREKRCMALAEEWVSDLNLRFPLGHFISLEYLRRSVFELLMKV